MKTMHVSFFELHTFGSDNYLNNLYNRWREVPGATIGKPIGYIDSGCL